MGGETDRAIEKRVSEKRAESVIAGIAVVAGNLPLCEICAGCGREVGKLYLCESCFEKQQIICDRSAVCTAQRLE